MTITEFLLARIAEDESEQRDPALAWHAGDCERNTYSSGACDCGIPERVLAECGAKRWIIEQHPLGKSDPGSGEDGCRGACAGGCFDWWVDEGPCHTLRVLAEIYAGHADYQEAWRFKE